MTRPRTYILWAITAIVGASLGCAAVAGAQSITGALEGTVLAGDGVPIAGVQVTIRSVALLGTRMKSTDERGHFAFLSIPGGSYDIELRRLGYTPVRVTDVVVVLGGTATLRDIRLTPQAAQLDEIVISGARPMIDFTSAAAAITLDSTRFRALPTERDFRALLAVVPQGNPSAYGDGVNFNGSTGFDNAYFINGVQSTNPLSGDGGINVPFNFVREVQVVTGGYEAEFGRAQGAIVNVVTNSGGNDFEGEVVGFFTGNRLRAAPRWGLAQSPDERFSQYDVGISVGGPIRRDRLWFFAAYNPLVESKTVSFNGIPRQSDRRVRHLVASKLTWHPGSGTDLTFTLLGDPSFRKGVEAMEAWSPPLGTITDPRAVLGDFRDGSVAGTAQLRHQAGSRLLFAGSVSRLSNVRQYQRRLGADDFVSLARVDDYVTDQTSGNFGRSYRVNTTRTAGDGNLTILGAAHTMKLGFNVEQNAIHIPYFVQSSIWRDAQARPYNWYRAFIAGRGHNTVPSIYAQDSWEVTPRLRLNYGIRWESQHIAGDTGIRLTIRNEVAPRVGIVFQPGEPGTQKIAVSAGRFYEQIPLWSLFVWTMPQRAEQVNYARNPLVDSTGGDAVDLSTAGYPADRDTRGQHLDEITLAYERRVDAQHTFGVRGVRRELRWVVEDAIAEGATADAPAWILGNPGRGLLAHVKRATRQYSALEFFFERSGTARGQYMASYVLSRTVGNYSGEFETDTRVPASHAQQAMDWPAQWTHDTGPLPNDRRHLIKLSGSYRASGALTLGGIGYFASGTPISEFAADPYAYDRTNVRDRGTVGRTPSIWNVDARVTYAVRSRGRILLDVFNVGNQRRATDIEQLHYTNAARTEVNPNYLEANQYQPSLRARLGIVVGF
jgi:outer membrane receptor protein involved in Fe transport